MSEQSYFRNMLRHDLDLMVKAAHLAISVRNCAMQSQTENINIAIGLHEGDESQARVMTVSLPIDACRHAPMEDLALMIATELSRVSKQKVE